MLYEKIEKLATEQGFSIRKIEQDCELSNGSIVKWKENKPIAISLLKVAKYLGTTVEELLKGEE